MPARAEVYILAAYIAVLPPSFEVYSPRHLSSTSANVLIETLVAVTPPTVFDELPTVA